VKRRCDLVEPDHPTLSLRKQCELLGVARSTLGYEPVGLHDAQDLRIMRLLDELYLRDPCLGTRRLVTVLLRDHGLVVNRKRLQRLRRHMGHEALWCKPRTSIPGPEAEIYPYLLRSKVVERHNQVWCADITYVPMAGGQAYLCAVMDWHSRMVLGWAVSNTMGVELCLKALQKAFANQGRAPEICNTDQGSQFTSQGWTQALQERGVQISMDGRGRWMDNVFIERLRRSVKYEDIYLREYATVAALEQGLKRWMAHYNHWRPHQALGNRTPAEVHGTTAPEAKNLTYSASRQKAAA
jgi:putative transposase